MSRDKKIQIIVDTLNKSCRGQFTFDKNPCGYVLFGKIENIAEQIFDALEQQRMNRVVLESGKHMQYGDTVQNDHTIKTFEVSVRTMGHITCEGIKDLIQTKHEVVEIEEIDSLRVVRKP